MEEEQKNLDQLFRVRTFPLKDDGEHFHERPVRWENETLAAWLTRDLQELLKPFIGYPIMPEMLGVIYSEITDILADHSPAFWRLLTIESEGSLVKIGLSETVWRELEKTERAWLRANGFDEEGEDEGVET